MGQFLLIISTNHTYFSVACNTSFPFHDPFFKSQIQFQKSPQISSTILMGQLLHTERDERMEPGS